MKEDMLCDIAALALDDDSASESVLICRENYAKQALMMFYPHRSINDLMRNNSFGGKFVEVGGLTPYNPRVDKTRNINNLRETRCFWEKGKDILHNIQARQTMENEMKRPLDPVQIQTKKS